MLSMPRMASSSSDTESTSSSLSSRITDDTLVSSNSPLSTSSGSSSPKSLKRQRSPSPSPPLISEAPSFSLSASAISCDISTPTPTLARALHVLRTEAAALAHINHHYHTSATAQDALLRAIDLVSSSHRRGGKLLACGIGKSALIARKLVATFKSLGVGASFLHAGDATHGDMGDIRPGDTLLFISYSGTTPELVSIVDHLDPTVPVLVLTGHSDHTTCPLLVGCENGVLLPACTHESEEASFGLAAPTSSTTVAMAVGDMLALSIAERVHEGDEARVFKRNHPGGAIGARTAKRTKLRDEKIISLADTEPGTRREALVY